MLNIKIRVLNIQQLVRGSSTKAKRATIKWLLFLLLIQYGSNYFECFAR
jgi:hypothetical protein